jgi:hypothetical protein
MKTLFAEELESGTIKLSENATKRLIDEVEKRLLGRHRVGTLESEADFLSGAMTVCNTIFGEGRQSLPSWVPGLWTMYPMVGQSVVEFLLNRDEEEE